METGGELTIINYSVGIVEIYAMITVWEDMNIIILYSSKIQLIQQCQCILHVYIVVGDTVHDQKSDVLVERSHVRDTRVIVASSIVLRRVHIPFSVDRVVESPVRDRCNGHTVGERLPSVLLESLQCHESTI